MLGAPRLQRDRQNERERLMLQIDAQSVLIEQLQSEIRGKDSENPKPRSVPSLCRAPLVDHDAASEHYTVIYSGFVVRQVQEPVISQVLIFVKTRTKLRPSRAKRSSKFIIRD